MKKSLSIFIIITILIIPLSLTCVFAENSFSTTKDGITLTVTLDKDYYAVGEQIIANAKVENNSSRNIIYTKTNELNDIPIGIKHKTEKGFFIGNGAFYYVSGRPTTPAYSEHEILNGEDLTSVTVFNGNYHDKGQDNKNYQEGTYQGESIFYFFYEDDPETINKIEIQFPVVISNDEQISTEEQEESQPITDSSQPTTKAPAPTKNTPTPTKANPTPQPATNNNPNKPVPNPPTDVEGIAVALITAITACGVLIITSKKK